MRSEQQKIGIALETLTSGLLPFFERELREVYGPNWEETAGKSSFRGQQSSALLAGKWDAHAVLTVMWDQWNSVFRHKLGMLERSLVSELREFRNRWAHQDEMSDDDCYRLLDSAQRLLTAVGAVKEAADIEVHKLDILRNILGQRVNEDVAAAQFARERVVDVSLYLISGLAVTTTMFILYGSTRFLPTVVMTSFTAFVFGYLIYKRTKQIAPVYGVHECPKCTKIVYSEVCPYCDPPSRSSSTIKTSSSLKFPPFADRPVRAK